MIPANWHGGVSRWSWKLPSADFLTIYNAGRRSNRRCIDPEITALSDLN